MEKPDPHPSGQLLMIRLADIDASDNIRQTIEEEPLAALAESIRLHGVLTPIIVVADSARYRIIEGHRRVKAAKLAGLTEIPAIVRKQATDGAASITHALVINCLREELSPLDVAKALNSPRTATKSTAAQLAAMTGFSPSKVSRHLSLLTLPETIQQQVHQGKVPASTAVELMQMNEPDRNAALQKLAGPGVTRDELAGLRRRVKHAPQERSKNAMRATAVLGNEKTVTVSSPHLDLDQFIEVLQEILEKARKGRTRGVKLATFLRMLKDSSEPP